MAERFNGNVQVVDSDGRVIFELGADSAHMELGADGSGGSVGVHDRTGEEVLTFRQGNLQLGPRGGSTMGAGGRLTVLDEDGNTVCSISRGLELRGGGDVRLFDGTSNLPRVRVDGTSGRIQARDAEKRMTYALDAEEATIQVGMKEAAGQFSVQDAHGAKAIWMGGEDALLHVGTEGNEGDVRVIDGEGNVRIHLDGASGDIKLHGADCAEDLPVDSATSPQPGTVLVINDDQLLAASDRPYDPRVAGVVSGAGGLQPGIRLGHERTGGTGVPVAVTGRAYCRVDADCGSIEVGDLLTTASVPGHAMRARDRDRAFGTVLGKALASLDAGRGLVPVLVALQ